MAGGLGVRVLVLSVALVACGESQGGDGSGNERGGSQSAGTSGAGGSSQSGTGGTSGAATGGNAGNAGSSAGTANAGAAGSSAGSTAVGETEACMAYAAAACRRNDMCSGFAPEPDPYPCSTSCPDLMFAPGSTRTVEALLECAAVYPTWSCEDILTDRFPPCVTPGTRQLGEPCRFSSQCQSLECNLTGGGCGTCARLVGENEDCLAADAICASGFLCTSGVCRRRSPTIKPFGEPCESYADCDQSNGRCNEQGICELYPGENESCADFNKCTSAFYCASADHVCRPRPGAGEPCVDDAASGPACGSGLLCTNTGFPVSGTCVAPTEVDVGGDCTSRTSFCVEGATCTCLEPTACPEKRCLRPRIIGEPCSDTDPCHPVLECTNGTCVTGTYQGIFEATCGQ